MADEVIDTPQAAEPASPIQQPEPQQVAAAPMPAEQVNVFNRDGDLVSIPKEHYEDALNQGYQPATEQDVIQHFQEEKYGGLGQQAVAALEGGASAATFGASTGLEKALGVKTEDIQGRKETGIGGAVGQVAGLLIPGAPEARALKTVGEAIHAAIPATTIMAKVGSGAARAAAETAMVQGGDEVSKMLADPSKANDAAQTALMNVGLAAMMGSAIGAGTSSINPLWKAGGGSKVGTILKAISDRAGGIEGVVPDEVNATIARSGMQLPPEIKAGLSPDPAIQEMVSTLNQSDTTASGRSFQEKAQQFRKDAGDAIADSFGRKLEDIPDHGEISKYESGKSIGQTLAAEYKEQMNPLVKAYDDIRSKYGNIPLDQSAGTKSIDPEIAKQISKAAGEVGKLSKAAKALQDKGDVQGAIEASAKVNDAQNELINLQTRATSPGTVDTIVHDISTLAQKEGWTASPSSDIMKELNRIQKELPNAKTINELGNYIKAVGTNMQSDPMNGPMRRAGGMIKSIMKKAESDLVGRTVGSEEGEAAAASFDQARKAYAVQSTLKEALDSRLHAGGSTAGFEQSLKTMAQTDGETLLRRLSGTNDTDLLNILSSKYPKTAEMLKNYHINEILARSKEGDTLKPDKFIKSLNKISPELRGFIANDQSLSRVKAISSLLEQFDTIPHNFSNTARTVDKLFQGIPATAVGIATMLASHNPVTAVLLASLTKALSKDIPDATRLALLKFLGSGQPIEAEGFHAAVNFINDTIKGQNLASKAVKNILTAGSEVLPQSFLPNEASRKRLDKQLKAIQTDPSLLQNTGNKTAHYMPEHGTAMAQTATQASNYLNSIRPGNVQKSPLDTKQPPNSVQQASFNRALDIAEQPLVVLQRIKDGTLTSKDLIHLQNISPNAYSMLRQKLTEEISSATEKGISIPYRQRLGMSLFLGQALDSTMTPNGIVSAQPKPQQPPQQQQAPAQAKTSVLKKMPDMYRTPSQASEQHRADKG